MRGYVARRADSATAPVGVAAFLTNTVVVDGVSVKFGARPGVCAAVSSLTLVGWLTEIWDTAGQERFRTITQAYFRGSHGMLLVFDVGARKSFDNIKHWIDQIKAHTKDTGRDMPPPKIVLIGNKCDLPASQRKVSREEAEALATKPRR